MSIEIKNLCKYYKDCKAVDGLSLNIKDGEFFSLLGMNGAGKTTTIKVLSCLTKPTSGDALLNGHSVVDEPQSVKRIINISPQETAVASNLSVKENLKFFAEIYGLSKSDAEKKALELLKLFKLLDKANSKPKTLSGGYQRRLSIAIALISSPQILFLDEPTLGLDVIARRELWAVLNKLKGKITIVLTTHYMEESEMYSDRVGIMSMGNLISVGTVDELKKKTKTKNLEEAFIKLAGLEE